MSNVVEQQQYKRIAEIILTLIPKDEKLKFINWVQADSSRSSDYAHIAESIKTLVDCYYREASYLRVDEGL